MEKSVSLPRQEAYLLLFCSVVLFVLTGCGPMVNGKRVVYADGTSALTQNSGSTTVNQTQSNATVYTPSTSTPGASPSTSPSPYVENPNHSNGVPVIEYTVSGVGYQSVNLSVRTGRVLRMKFKPNQNSKYIAGTNIKPHYAHLAIYVTINGQSLPTEMLSNGLQGGNADESSILDLSYLLKPTCPESNSACRETFLFKVERPNDDYFCITTGQGCPWTHVPDKHPWSGTLSIQTDDTEAL